MGFLDAILGRSKPPLANIDVLFSLPQAALSLQVEGFAATGSGAVCYRDVEGTSDDAVIAEVDKIISTGGSSTVTHTRDSYGFHWLRADRQGRDVSGLVADLHAVNSSLMDAGFGASLLCSTILFTTPAGIACALVYLFKQGTFYPFVPMPGDHRDNAVELQMRGLIADDVPVEPKLDRWLALWGAPGLDPQR